MVKDFMNTPILVVDDVGILPSGDIQILKLEKDGIVINITIEQAESLIKLLQYKVSKFKVKEPITEHPGRSSYERDKSVE